MSKFWIMLFHTYKNKITTKSFIISTAITVLLVLAVTNLQSIISVFQSDDGKRQIAVIDETGGLYPAFAKQLKAADTDNDLQAMETKESEKDAVKRVKDGEWDGLFIIRQDQKGTITGAYKALTISDESAYKLLKQALTQTKPLSKPPSLAFRQKVSTSTLRRKSAKTRWKKGRSLRKSSVR